MNVSGVQKAFINGGRQLHLSHGPIELIIGVEGDADHISRAYTQAASRFDGLLEELVAELPKLRAHAEKNYSYSSPVSQRMAKAVSAMSRGFVTPMAAVAGAVADEILLCMRKNTELRRAYVNNGGDIALYVAPGQKFTAGVVADVTDPAIVAKVCVKSEDAIGGIATSGWQGRSHSLGIADAVTVLARDASCADAAATLIANAIDVPHSDKIHRQPANELSPDSDLGTLPITVFVGSLNAKERECALVGGEALARELCGKGLLKAAYLSLQGTVKTIDKPAMLAA
ncbi:MAG: UPF0280 family protein [Hyphomicrobiales bacterium]